MRLKGRSDCYWECQYKSIFLGDKDEMEKAIKNCIDIGASGSGFILASGCDVPGIVPYLKTYSGLWMLQGSLEHISKMDSVA